MTRETDFFFTLEDASKIELKSEQEMSIIKKKILGNCLHTEVLDSLHTKVLFAKISPNWRAKILELMLNFKNIDWAYNLQLQPNIFLNVIHYDALILAGTHSTPSNLVICSLANCNST